MAQIINVSEIDNLAERPALAQFVNAVNEKDPATPGYGGAEELISSIITGAIRAIDALEARIVELEGR